MRKYLIDVIHGRRNKLGDRLLRGLLFVFSLVFKALIVIRNFLYQKNIFPQRSLGRPVISIGNLTWGGVGKTPFALFLAREIIERKLHPAILLRGYRGNKVPGTILSDEAELLKASMENVVVGVGSNRIKAGQEILNDHNIDVFVLDDGFQHRKVARDMDIVMIDATNPFGNGKLIPAGILREPLSALSRADVVVLSRVDQAGSQAQDLIRFILRCQPNAVIIQAIHQPVCFYDGFGADVERVDFVRGRALCAFSSIGNPNGFEGTLNSLGGDVRKHFIYPDHHLYQANEIIDMASYCQAQGIDTLVTTEKDSVKIKEFKSEFRGLKVLILKIKIEVVNGKAEFDQRIDRLLRG